MRRRRTNKAGQNNRRKNDAYQPNTAIGPDRNYSDHFNIDGTSSARSGEFAKSGSR
jgi:hypothetical protein